MKLILVRHGETEENKQEVAQGWLPGRLTEDGKKQATRLGLRLKDLRIDIIYTSDLQRCIDTTAEITKHHPRAELLQDKRLRERSMGSFEGKKHAELDWNSIPGDPITRRPPGGETFEELRNRVHAFLSDIITKHPNKTVLVSTHGGPLRMFEGLLLHKNLKESLALPYYKNTAVSEYEIDANGKATAIRINCDAHLR